MAATFHTDDIVTSHEDTTILAVIERTHGDTDAGPTRNDFDEKIHRHASISSAAYRKFLREGIPPSGAVLVRWLHDERLELIEQSLLKILDRSFLIGDVVKRHTKDAMSGIVLNTFTTVNLQAISTFYLPNDDVLRGFILDGPGALETDGMVSVDPPVELADIPVAELTYAEPFSDGDLVIFKDHLGIVETVYSMITLRLSNNSVVEIHEDFVECFDESFDAFSVGDIVRSKKGDLRSKGRWIYGGYNPNVRPLGTIVQVRPVSALVTWLHRRIGSPAEPFPPDELERDELESDLFQVYRRTLGPSDAATEPTVSNTEIEVQIGTRVRFRDLSAACAKYESKSDGTFTRIPRTETMGYDMNVYDVRSIKSEVTIQWQDLSITREDSTSLVPDPTIEDEHSTWPGEIVHTLDIQPIPGLNDVHEPSKIGVVQSVDADERMAKVRWCPSACVHYSYDPNDLEASGAHGKPIVHTTIGVADGDAEEVSLYDIEAPGALNVRRGDIVNIHAASTTTTNGEAGANWLGEIVEDRSDGTLLVRLGAAKPIIDVVLRREEVVVAIRSDEALPDDGMSEESMEEGWDEDSLSDENWMFDADDDMADFKYEDENGDPMDIEEVENEEWESDEEDEDEDEDQQAGVQLPSSTGQQSFPTGQSQISDPHPTSELEPQLASEPASIKAQHYCQPYLMLDTSPPQDHAFINSPPLGSTLSMKRVQKEHKIFQKGDAIPSGVYVRAWEERLDILRILFIGPEYTPYSLAPFVIDLYLPNDFPQSPPKAFFHSWTGERGLGGTGRVNPNLYEDGTICLSLLGTWSGNKMENWNATRSTLLQVVVSILGLVLVKEPYFNEAGYEHLAGLEASRRPSALYSERAFLRSKTFAISALSAVKSGDKLAGLDGLRDVLETLYLGRSGSSTLERIIEEVQGVLRRSEEEATAEPDGLTIMSRGACIPLRRVLTRLQQFTQ